MRKSEGKIAYITNKLITNPSYLKKGDNYLANCFNCSTATIRRIKGQLSEVKKNYVDSLVYCNNNNIVREA